MAGFSFFTDFLKGTAAKEYGENMPDWQDINAGQIQQQTVADNLATFDSAKALATDYNDYMQNVVSERLKKANPYYEGTMSQMAKNISEKLKGQIPKDVVNQIWRSGTAKARTGGVSGGPGSFGFNIVPRDLGLNSLQIQSQAESEWSPFVSTVASLNKAPMFDFSSVFMTPQERVNLAMKNQENRWNIANTKAQISAQPAPWMTALGGFGDSLTTAAAGYFTMNPNSFSGGNNSNAYQWNPPERSWGV